MSNPQQKPEPVQQEPPEEPYSVFTKRQKWMIAIAASVSTFFSPLASSIYYPALNTVASDLHVSNTLINLTITVFSVINCIQTIANNLDHARTLADGDGCILRQSRKKTSLHSMLHHLPLRQRRPRLTNQLRRINGSPVSPKRRQQRHSRPLKRSRRRHINLSRTRRIHGHDFRRRYSRFITCPHNRRINKSISQLALDILVPSYFRCSILRSLPSFLPRNMSLCRWEWLHPSSPTKHDSRRHLP